MFRSNLILRADWLQEAVIVNYLLNGSPKVFEFKYPVGPNIDLSEDANEIVIKADVPGVHAKDLQIVIKEGFLQISGEKRQPVHRNKVRYICLERSYGKFCRKLYLNAAIDINAVRAKLHDGLVTIWLPKLPNRRQLERTIPLEP
jgi:HSP20 family protein